MQPDRLLDHELLAQQEEVRLGRAVQSGREAARRLDEDAPQGVLQVQLERQVAAGKVARAQLVRHNMRLVAAVARRYPRRWASFDDLLQWGAEGLVRAADKFDPDKPNSARFGTYARFWIRKYVEKGLERQNWRLKLSEGTGRRAGAVQNLIAMTRQQQEARQEHGNTAGDLGPVMSAEAARTLSRLEHALDDVAAHDVPDPETVESTAERQLVLDRMLLLLRDLSEEHLLVAVRLYGIGGAQVWSLQQLADALGTTVWQVKKKRDQGLAAIREEFGEPPL